MAQVQSAFWVKLKILRGRVAPETFSKLRQEFLLVKQQLVPDSFMANPHNTLQLLQQPPPIFFKQFQALVASLQAEDDDDAINDVVVVPALSKVGLALDKILSVDAVSRGVLELGVDDGAAEADKNQTVEAVRGAVEQRGGEMVGGGVKSKSVIRESTCGATKVATSRRTISSLIIFIISRIMSTAKFIYDDGPKASQYCATQNYKDSILHQKLGNLIILATILNQIIYIYKQQSRFEICRKQIQKIFLRKNTYY